MVRKLYGVSLYAWKKRLGSPRFYLVSLLTVPIVHYFSDGIVRICADAGTGYSPAELFTFIACDHLANAFLYLVWIALMCGDSFEDEGTSLLVLRSGRRTWSAGMAGHIILVGLIYWFIVFGVCMALLHGYWLWSDGWSRMTMTMAYTTAASDYALNLTIPLKITALYRVWEAAFASFLLHVLVSALMGLCALSIGGIWGIVIPLAFVLLDISFYGLGLPKFVYFFSPVSLSDLSVLDPTRTDYLPSLRYAFLALTMGVLLLIAACQIKASRKNFCA